MMEMPRTPPVQPIPYRPGMFRADLAPKRAAVPEPRSSEPTKVDLDLLAEARRNIEASEAVQARRVADDAKEEALSPRVKQLIVKPLEPAPPIVSTATKRLEKAKVTHENAAGKLLNATDLTEDGVRDHFKRGLTKLRHFFLHPNRQERKAQDLLQGVDTTEAKLRRLTDAERQKAFTARIEEISSRKAVIQKQKPQPEARVRKIVTKKPALQTTMNRTRAPETVVEPPASNLEEAVRAYAERQPVAVQKPKKRSMRPVTENLTDVERAWFETGDALAEQAEREHRRDEADWETIRALAEQIEAEAQEKKAVEKLRSGRSVLRALQEAAEEIPRSGRVTARVKPIATNRRAAA